MTEDFYRLIMATPEAERHGQVFRLNRLQTHTPITAKWVCRIVAAIGKAAGVVVASGEKRRRDKVTGKLAPVPTRKFAAAHDLRRSLGTRWARRVMPAVLQRLMRHAEVATTMKYYYVTMDADTVADEVWGRDWDSGNTSGNIGPQKAQNAEGAPDAATSETPCGDSTCVSGGQGSRTLNGLRRT